MAVLGPLRSEMRKVAVGFELRGGAGAGLGIKCCSGP
jgi:hypothetical protein